MSIPKTIWDAAFRAIVQDRWDSNSVDGVYEDLRRDYPDRHKRERFERQFEAELDQYIEDAVDNLTEEQLLEYVNEPDVWRQVIWTQLGAFMDDPAMELDDWLRAYLKVEVGYAG